MKTGTIKFMFIGLIINLLSGCTISSQKVQFPSNLNLSQNSKFLKEVVKISNFPFYADNIHVNPTVKVVTAASTYGIDLLNKVPSVCQDDYRYGHKYNNTLGEDELGYLSIMYWLPSNGNYLLFDFVLDNDMEYYKEFLVTTDLNGVIIDYLLVNDGWSGSSGANFIQSTLLSDLTLQQTEIKLLSSKYVPHISITTFPGQKVDYIYKISTDGKFVLQSKNEHTQRTFNITELKGLIEDLP